MLKIGDKVIVKSETKIREEFTIREYEIHYNVVTNYGASKKIVDIFNEDMFNFCNKQVTILSIMYLSIPFYKIKEDGGKNTWSEVMFYDFDNTLKNDLNKFCNDCIFKNCKMCIINQNINNYEIEDTDYIGCKVKIRSEKYIRKYFEKDTRFGNDNEFRLSKMFILNGERAFRTSSFYSNMFRFCEKEVTISELSYCNSIQFQFYIKEDNKQNPWSFDMVYDIDLKSLYKIKQYCLNYCVLNNCELCQLKTYKFKQNNFPSNIASNPYICNENNE